MDYEQEEMKKEFIHFLKKIGFEKRYLVKKCVYLTFCLNNPFNFYIEQDIKIYNGYFSVSTQNIFLFLKQFNHKYRNHGKQINAIWNFYYFLGEEFLRNRKSISQEQFDCLVEKVLLKIDVKDNNKKSKVKIL